MMSTPIAGPESSYTPPRLPPPAPYRPAPPKSPGLALALSLFPGLGQVYNGQPAKALVFFFAWVGSIYATVEINPLPFAFLIPFTYLYNLVDAWRSAALINVRAEGGVAPAEEPTPESPAWGISLVVLGSILLFHNLGWLQLAWLQRFWPALLIAAGIAFIYASLEKRKSAGSGDVPPAP
jgi:TM2 domain-containing membrane protein YozV